MTYATANQHAPVDGQRQSPHVGRCLHDALRGVHQAVRKPYAGQQRADWQQLLVHQIPPKPIERQQRHVDAPSVEHLHQRLGTTQTLVLPKPLVDIPNKALSLKRFAIVAAHGACVFKRLVRHPRHAAQGVSAGCVCRLGVQAVLRDGEASGDDDACHERPEPPGYVKQHHAGTDSLEERTKAAVAGDVAVHKGTDLLHVHADHLNKVGAVVLVEKCNALQQQDPEDLAAQVHDDFVSCTAHAVDVHAGDEGLEDVHGRKECQEPSILLQRLLLDENLKQRATQHGRRQVACHTK